MAKKMRFKKPNLSMVWGQIIALCVWLVFGDKIVDVLDNLVGADNTVLRVNVSTATSGCTNGSIFEDAYEFLGIGSDCSTAGVTTDITANSSNGLLGIVALILTVAILMNFISYN